MRIGQEPAGRAYIRHRQPNVPGLPVIVGRMRDAVFAEDLSDLKDDCGFFQNRDDLGFGKSGFLHHASPRSSAP